MLRDMNEISSSVFTVITCWLQPPLNTVQTVNGTIAGERHLKIGLERLQCDGVASQTRPNPNRSTRCLFDLSLCTVVRASACASAVISLYAVCFYPALPLLLHHH